MTAEEYLKTRNRLCDFYWDVERRNGKCRMCEMDVSNNGYSMSCYGFELRHPKEAITIVERWGKEHPCNDECR